MSETIDELDIIEEGTEVVANRGSKMERLENEGDLAADYLEELLDIVDLDGDIEIDVENGRALVEIVTGDEEPDRRLKRLIGRHGEVLEALQELTRLAVQSQTGERSRLMLDIAGYRTNRRLELQELVERLGAQVQETGEPVQLDPMNPFERKVCHDKAAQMGLYSESEGVAPHRYVVLSLDEGDDEDFEDEDQDDFDSATEAHADAAADLTDTAVDEADNAIANTSEEA
ncbi:protein jag [Mobiluncus curtisii]|uniref:R3H domain protein n=1 Tax=Mobiluncus curtisii ATCC 51333 TaxID=887326 RepID=E6LWG1_9ACTO|nr:R3H domain-containing nucleic acid-binding protein [Mobiluncus curtisii]EFU81046.1 R3H domain protein [Mobiluncus curtisii ATCC 51333]